MTIRESLYFIYAGETSQDYGLINVNMQSGMQSEPFVASRSIREVKTRHRDQPFFQEIVEEPLEFTVSFAFENEWTSESKRAVARWLTSKKFYMPMQFSSNLDVIYYCICIDSPELIHNCASNGYINLKFRCDGAYRYSPIYQSTISDYSTNGVNGTSYTFENYGDVECNPVLYIEKIGTGDDIKIVNTSNGGQSLIMSGLANLENVTIDNEAETIDTDIPLTYRYSNHNGIFLTMVTGLNYLQIYGNCNIQWKMQFKLLQD